MPLTERDEDHLLSLAFSLHNNPGAYALLLGAGISMPEVPSAWGILNELVAKQAEASGDAPADALQWYRDRHDGADPSYETFLEEMAQTQDERQRMLLRYFEPTTGDGPQPTETHRAIARLVAVGSVRVILTLNFDKLLERALLDEGITPTVVETPHKLGKRLPPLHTVRCCLVHVHGDYLSPMSMLNTEKELGQGYHRKLTKFLRQVLENYGLVIAGWSSTYDPVLRDLIRDKYSGRYTPTWIEPNDPSEHATDLIGLLNGRLVRANGEDAIGRLADAVEAMQAAQRTQHPLSVTTAAETAKRELAGGRVSISLHDTFHTQLERLAKRPEFTVPEDPHAANQALQALGDVAGATRSASEACTVPAALAACIGRWGGGETVRWLCDAIVRFSQPLSPAMNHDVASLSLIASEVLLYAGGVAATAGERWDDVVKLLALRTPQPDVPRETRSVSRRLLQFRPLRDPSRTILFNQLGPILAEALVLGDEPLGRAWERFEILRLAHLAVTAPGFANKAATAIEAVHAQAKALDAREKAAFDGSDKDRAQAELSRITHDELIPALSDVVQGSLPAPHMHVRVANADLINDDLYFPAARLMLADSGLIGALAAAGFDSKPENIATALRSVDYSAVSAIAQAGMHWGPPFYELRDPRWLNEIRDS